MTEHVEDKASERERAELPTLREWMLELFPGADLEKLDVRGTAVLQIAESYAKAQVQAARREERQRIAEFAQSCGRFDDDGIAALLSVLDEEKL